MGGSLSQERMDELASEYFHTIPDNYMNVGIDKSLLTYSGLNSTVELENYSSALLDELGSSIPAYVEKVGSALVDAALVPNAVGLGALVISMILQICFIAAKDQQSKEPGPVDMLRRIFAEEKSSEVRDLMQEYLKRYEMHLQDNHLLLEESKRLEQQLSYQLTRLQNSMLVDGHMTTRALKQWANGAAFHTQMLIHIARLTRKQTPGDKRFRNAAIAAIRTYDKASTALLQRYKAFRVSKLGLYIRCVAVAPAACTNYCTIRDEDSGHKLILGKGDYCRVSAEAYINYLYPKERNIIGLTNYFPNLQNNINILIDQQGTFNLQLNNGAG